MVEALHSAVGAGCATPLAIDASHVCPLDAVCCVAVLNGAAPIPVDEMGLRGLTAL